MTQERPPAGGAAANGSPEVPHPAIGVRDLRSERLELAAGLTGPGSDGIARRGRDRRARRAAGSASSGSSRPTARTSRASRSAPSAASGAATRARSATSTCCSCTRAAATRPRSSRRSRRSSGTPSGTPASTWTTRSARSRSAARSRPRTSRPPSGCSTCSRSPATRVVIARAKSALLEDWRSAARRRLPELLASTRQRAERHGELAYLIEPELKESRGGIRDAVVLSALAATWLTDRPHGAVDMAYAHLLDVRDTVQVVTRRHTNRLLLADQDEVAALVGFDDRDDLLASIAEAGARHLLRARHHRPQRAAGPAATGARRRCSCAAGARAPRLRTDRRGPGRARRRDRARRRRAPGRRPAAVAARRGDGRADRA